MSKFPKNLSLSTIAVSALIIATAMFSFAGLRESTANAINSVTEYFGISSPVSTTAPELLQTQPNITAESTEPMTPVFFAGELLQWNTFGNSGTVNDSYDPLNTLSVTVNGAAGAVQNGVTVSNISVSASGVVTADIEAATGSADAAFTLTVTDSGSLISRATLPVIVIAPSCAGTSQFVEQAHSTASDGSGGDQFGATVAISGDTMVVGAHLANT